MHGLIRDYAFFLSNSQGHHSNPVEFCIILRDFGFKRVMWKLKGKRHMTGHTKISLEGDRNDLKDEVTR